MKCPRDGGALAPHTLKKVEMDYCSYCEGAWLDAGELARLHGLETDLLPGASLGGLPQNPLLCPRCEVGMSRGEVVGSERVELDICPQCHGIWLDTNELKTVLQLAWDVKQAREG
ncbi:MAG: zf-TFIIB domain-containing protein [Armatimonadetes bacterium]|nr:zf-TFIIB domain-containing protein [Armatimonadota bacterium]